MPKWWWLRLSSSRTDHHPLTSHPIKQAKHIPPVALNFKCEPFSSKPENTLAQQDLVAHLAAGPN